MPGRPAIHFCTFVGRQVGRIQSEEREVGDVKKKKKKRGKQRGKIEEEKVYE